MKVLLILFLLLSNCFASNDELAGGVSVESFLRKGNLEGIIPNIFLSYHLHLGNAMFGGDVSSCFFMGGVKALTGYRFTPGRFETTPILMWGYYLFLSDVASGPGFGIILTPKELPFSLTTSLLRYRSKKERPYNGYWTHVEFAYDY